MTDYNKPYPVDDKGFVNQKPPVRKFKDGGKVETKKPIKPAPQKPISHPSEKMIKEGDKSAKKAKAADKDLVGGGYKKGGKVRVKGNKKK